MFRRIGRADHAADFIEGKDCCMPSLTFEPGGKTLHVKKGLTILQAARLHHVHIRTRCHGQASCLMCKVLVTDDRSKAALSAPAPRERFRLGDRIEQGYRLACQAVVQGDARVTIPEDPLKAVIRNKLANRQQEQEDLW